VAQSDNKATTNKIKHFLVTAQLGNICTENSKKFY